VPDFVFDVPPASLAIYFSLIAIGAVFFGLIVAKPVDSSAKRNGSSKPDFDVPAKL
jgi:hypothetical protein